MVINISQLPIFDAADGVLLSGMRVYEHEGLKGYPQGDTCPPDRVPLQQALLRGPYEEGGKECQAIKTTCC